MIYLSPPTPQVFEASGVSVSMLALVPDSGAAVQGVLAIAAEDEVAEYSIFLDGAEDNNA